MPRALRRHPAWEMYQLMTRDLGISHDEALGRLFEAAPDLPIDLIIAAEGDMAKTLEELTGAQPPSRPDSGRADPRTAERLLREAIRQGADQQGEPQSFNDAIRGRAAERTNGVTVELSREAITGIKGQGEYDPASDFIRQGFAARDQR